VADPGRPKETSDHIHVSFCPYSSVWTILSIVYFTNLFLFLYLELELPSVPRLLPTPVD
jgi:hypothetical protein